MTVYQVTLLEFNYGVYATRTLAERRRRKLIKIAIKRHGITYPLQWKIRRAALKHPQAHDEDPMNFEKVYCFYNFRETHMVFMFTKPTTLTSDQLEELREQARERMGDPHASMEVIVA